jgi:hypothetical protein
MKIKKINIYYQYLYINISEQNAVNILQSADE